MAEIRVEKKGPHIWMWIVALIVILLLGWLIYEMFMSPGGVRLPETSLMMTTLITGGG